MGLFLSLCFLSRLQLFKPCRPYGFVSSVTEHRQSALSVESRMPADEHGSGTAVLQMLRYLDFVLILKIRSQQA